MGIKTKLTPLIGDKIVEAVRKFYTRNNAAALVGIGASTLSAWMSKGERGESPYAEFYERMKLAEGEAEAELVDVCVQHAKISPKFAMTFLSRARPADWARHDNLTVTRGPTDSPDGTGASEELAKRILRMVQSQRELESGPTTVEGEIVP